MQFKVPQFIEIEDKIFGPLTFKQFAFLLGGVGGVYLFYKLLPFWLAIFFIIPIGGLSLLLAFYKYNGKPFVFYLQAGLNFILSKKLYIWKQRVLKEEDIKKEIKIDNITSVVPVVTKSDKIKDLSWKLDVQENENNRFSKF